jgi:23S rRNA pseudouridine1911/1915/1917 synthase
MNQVAPPCPILFEDNHLLIVEKPINVLSQADDTGDTDLLTMLKDYIKVAYNKPGNVYLGLVHRLDRPVGGAMAFAKTSKSASRLSDQVRTRTIQKTYTTIQILRYFETLLVKRYEDEYCTGCFIFNERCQTRRIVL